MYKAKGKENSDEEDVKETYILLSETLAVVVTSAVRGTTGSPVVDVDVICIQRSIRWYDCMPTTLYLYRCQDVVHISFLHMDYLCHI